MPHTTPRVLFVCTGNIFRSLTAEYALRRALDGTQMRIAVASAGTEDYPHVVAPVVRDYLGELGLDVRSHVRRTLTEAILTEPGWVVAMSTDHRAALAARFGQTVPLFTEACGLPGAALPDVEEVVADHATNPAAVAAHVRATIDRIVALTPRLVRQVERWAAAHAGAHG
jgi:protein-tyrosine phosphatase